MGQSAKNLRSVALGCLAAGAFLSAGQMEAMAQSAPPIPLGDSGIFLAPQPMAEAAPFQEPGSDYTGVRVGPWELNPTLFSGLAFNDNLYQTTTGRIADVGWRETPTFVAINDSGINKLSLYATADSLVYFRHPDADAVTGHIGLEDAWAIRPDLVLRLDGDVSRQTDTVDSGQIVGASTVLPLHYWQYQASASVLKSFDRFFVGVGGTYVDSTYDNAAQTNGPSLPQSYRDLDASTLVGRAGYYIGPTIYSYVEATENLQNYRYDPLYSSNGYRAVGGLGSDQLSLFKGEIYAGYEEQFYRSAIGGAIGGATFGGKISWLPTEFITVSAKVAQSLGTSIASSLTPTIASATETTSASLKVVYALAQTWSAAAHVDFSNVHFYGSPRTDDDWGAGLTFSRRVWENLDGTVDYQLSRVNSNFADASYTQDVISLGLTYKY